ncbi:MAG: hypothetical protein K2Q10_09595, partial [Rhodospirillales bacterium]|nr:hypothetical protein [Rhodospirillales bacterium]
MPITRPAAALLAGLAFLPLIQPAAAADIAVPMPGNTARKVTLYHASAALAVGIGATANVENAQVLAQGLKERGYNARSIASIDGVNLRDLVREFLAKDGVNPDSRLLLWFSGLTQMAEALPLDELAAMLNMAAARHILVVLDGCSESPAFRWSEPVAGAVDWPALLPGRQVLAHCGSDPRLFRERFLTLLSGTSPADTN